MGAENSIAAPSEVQCGACMTHNPSSATFCKGCGHALYEPCQGCAKPVLLTQKFCEGCGADLDKALRERHGLHEKSMSEAVALAKASEFERALDVLAQIVKVQDYRFKEAVENSKQAIEKIEGLSNRAKNLAEEAMASAKHEFEKGNQLAAVKLLESVPLKLLTEDAKADLRRAKNFINELQKLESELKVEIANKNWPDVGSLIDRLLDLLPKEQQYKQLGKQVSEKLVASAKRSLQGGDYATSLRLLHSVPGIGRTKEFDRLRDSVEDIQWLSQQFADEPFVSPLLGRLAVRYSKAVPDNPDAQKLVKQLAGQLKSGDRPDRSHLPRWKGRAKSWMGGKAAMLGIPSSVEVGDETLLLSRAGRFSVAIGLALQGLGLARNDGHFGPKKKGLLGGLGRRKSSACWGIDLGTESMKAVCIENGEEGPEIIGCFFQEYETPLCRASFEGDALGVIQPVVDDFLEENDIEGIPLWGNIAGSQLITRFVRLPPLKDKQARALLQQEVEQKIPLPIDELAVATWMQSSAGDNDGIHGRPAVITAARQAVIDERLELYEELGLTLSGLQADSNAIVNFVAFEFADELSMEDDDDGEEDETPSAEQSEKTPAIALLDCGAATTNLVIVSGETHWSWTGELGGEDLTTALARVTKLTHSEAEQLKRNPAAIEEPSRHYAAVEHRQDELRVRIETVLADALNQNKRFEISQSWCVGGGCLAHQWVRRVMIEPK